MVIHFGAFPIPLDLDRSRDCCTGIDMNGGTRWFKGGNFAVQIMADLYCELLLLTTFDGDKCYWA